MANYLLDTNHLSPLVTLEHPLRKLVFQRPEDTDHFGIAVPALTEMLYGISTIPRAEKNLAEWGKLKAGFTYYQIDREDAEAAAALQVQLRRRGRQLGTVDALIAIIALRNDLILLTTDKDFNAVPNLKLENWVHS